MMRICQRRRPGLQTASLLNLGGGDVAFRLCDHWEVPCASDARWRRRGVVQAEVL